MFNSSYSSSAQLNIKIVRKKGSDQQVHDEVLDCLTNSPDHHHRKCLENSVENIHADIRV